MPDSTLSTDTDSVPTLPGYEEIGKTLAELAGECAQWEHVVDDALEEMESLGAEAVEKVRRLELERREAADRRRELDRQHDHFEQIAEAVRCQDARLEQTLAELDEIKTELAGARTGAEERFDALKQQVQDRLDELTRERDELRDQLNAVRQERAVLESELETVRRRAAEMDRALSEHKEHAEEQQARWSSELAELRGLLHRQTELLSRYGSPATPAIPSAPPAGGDGHVIREETTPRDDQIVGSVMAQFAKLQADVARRRRQE